MLSFLVSIAQLCMSEAIPMDHSLLPMKLIPCLVSLCKQGVEDTIRVKAANTIG